MLKYVITEKSINVVIKGEIKVCDKSNKYFDAIKQAIEENASETEIDYLLNKDTVDEAKTLLEKNWGRINK